MNCDQANLRQIHMLHVVKILASINLRLRKKIFHFHLVMSPQGHLYWQLRNWVASCCKIVKRWSSRWPRNLRHKSINSMRKYGSLIMWQRAMQGLEDNRKWWHANQKLDREEIRLAVFWETVHKPSTV